MDGKVDPDPLRSACVAGSRMKTKWISASTLEGGVAEQIKKARRSTLRFLTK
ncbi:MAG: hypothetical protein HXK83_08675 [Lachnospiraceae bacterium]|nr:hypothetical protein [Lachnospiraceae bacterium]